MIRRVMCVWTLGAVLAGAAPVAAQTGPSVRGLATIAVEQQAAADSFEAVTGSASVTTFGAGVQVTRVWRQLFVEIGAERGSLDGERVFVDGGTVERLGIPVTVTLTPLDVMAGWRFDGRRRLVPFVAAGVTSIGYRETSDFADSDENANERATGFVVVAGAEVRLRRLVHVRGDLRFRRAGGVLGDRGVSREYGEQDLGGFGAAVRLVIGR